MEERDYWLGFAAFPGVGPKKFALLLDSFDTAEKAWKADEEVLKKVIGKALTSEFLPFRKTFSFENYRDQMKEKDVWFTTLADEDYPRLLKTIDNPPFVLFGKGERKTLTEEKLVGVVGTRKVTSYGRQVSEMITRGLVDAGCCIVSGLALGVDAIAHQTTIDNGGRTIAVLGCGVDCCYPSANEKIYQEILENNGAVISEFSISMSPSVGSFPSRNRIIAGMSEAVVVTEGAEDSGSLITAEDALKFQRKVFAVPGQITSILARGPLKLLQKGAVLVMSGEDISKNLGITKAKVAKKIITGETKEEQKIIELLQNEPLYFDELVKKINIDSVKLASLLSLMEIKQFIIHTSTGQYSLTE